MPCSFSSTATFSSTLTYSLRFFNEQKKRTKESYLAWLDSISFYDVICLNHGNWLPIHRAKMCGEMNRELKQQRRRRLRKCHSKSESRCLKLYRLYSISFNSSNVGNFFRSWILKDCIEVQEKKKESRCLAVTSSKNLKLDTMGAYTSASWLRINCECGGIGRNDIFPDTLPYK